MPPVPSWGHPHRRTLQAQAPPEAPDYDVGMGGDPYFPGGLGARSAASCLYY